MKRRALQLLPQERRTILLQPVRFWTPGRKARLLDAIATGIVGRGDAKAAHNLSDAELDEWSRGFASKQAVGGLKATVRVPR